MAFFARQPTLPPQQPQQQELDTQTLAIVPARRQGVVASTRTEPGQQIQSKKKAARRHKTRQESPFLTTQSAVTATTSTPRSTGSSKNQSPVLLPNLGVMTLAEQRQHLERRNTSLRNDNRRLEGLLAQARLVVARNLSATDDDDGHQDDMGNSSTNIF